MGAKMINLKITRTSNKVDSFPSCSHILTKIFYINFAASKCRKAKREQQEFSSGNSLKYLTFLLYRLHFAQHKIPNIIFARRITYKSEYLFVKLSTITF